MPFAGECRYLCLPNHSECHKSIKSLPGKKNSRILERGNLWVHFNHHKWKPPLIFIRKRDFTGQYALSILCPSERPISPETLHGSKPLLCRNNGYCPSGVKGCKWTFSHPLVMIPLRHCGGYEFTVLKMKSPICKVQLTYWILLTAFLFDHVCPKAKGAFLFASQRWLSKLAFLSFGEMCTLETQVCEPENCSSLLSTHYGWSTIF